MDNRAEVKAFLSSRRARITPEQAGLTGYSRSGRVPGLRRSEVADLAGVSVEYYSQLERGNLRGVSDSVLDALARAAVGRGRTDVSGRPRARRRPHDPRPPQTSGAAGQARRGAGPERDDRGTGFRAQRAPGRAGGQPAGRGAVRTRLRRPGPAGQPRPVHLPRPRARDFWIDWDRAARDAVAMLRTEAGRDPHDRGLIDLVGELSSRSDAFRVRWAAHDVRLHRTGRKHMRHPVVGELHLSYDVMELPADPGLLLIAFSVEPGSRDDDALRLLAGWAATHDSADTLVAPHRA